MYGLCSLSSVAFCVMRAEPTDFQFFKAGRDLHSIRRIFFTTFEKSYDTN